MGRGILIFDGNNIESKDMNAEIIAVGSELLLGQIVDTNSSFIAKRLIENGIEPVRTATVGDDLSRIVQTIREAAGRSEIIITTGGIGPTEDDLTREAVSEVVGRPLVFQDHLMGQIEAIFRKRGFRMVEGNRKQAYIPEGAIPIENPKGSAPGFIAQTGRGVIVSVPGVPLEMEFLMKETVIPYLRKRFQLERQVIRYKVLRACGLGESAIGSQIKDLMRGDQNPSVGTLASVGDIRIRITAKAEDPEEASALIHKVEKEIRGRLGILIYGEDDETLQGIVSRQLEKLGLTLSVVETITGGALCQKLSGTESASFSGGLILPFDRAPSLRGFLDVTNGDFSSLNEAPKKLADSMAQKAKKEFGTDIGLAVHGGPMEKMEGKMEYRIPVYCSLSTSSTLETQEYVIGGELWTIRERSSIIVLDMLRKYLLKPAQSA